MRTREQRRRGAAKADLVLFGMALLLLALPLPVLLDGVDLGVERLFLLGIIVAVPAATLLLMHWRATRATPERAAPQPRPRRPPPAQVAPAPAPAPRRFASVGPATMDRRSSA